MGSPGSTNVNQTANIPDELKPLVNGSVGWTLGLQNALPLSQFTQYNPAGTADLSDLQKFGMEQTPGLSQWAQSNPYLTSAFGNFAEMPEIASRPVSNPAAEQAALAQLNQLTSGPIGSSPYTQQGMEAWKQFTLPQVQNEAALAGLGRSGPYIENVLKSQTQALMPLLQQEIGNREASVGQLGGIAGAETARELLPRQQTLDALGSTGNQMVNLAQMTFTQKSQAIEEALRAGQISRDVAQQQSDAARQEFMRLQSLSEAGTLGPLGQILPSMIGSNTSKSKDLFSGIMGK